MSYLIDYDAQALEFESGTELEHRLCGSRWPLAWHGERWLVTLPLNQWSWRFVPDSGLASLLLFGERKLDWSPVQPAEQRLRTDSGSRIVQPRYVRSLRLGEIEFRDLPVTTLPTQTGRIEEGLLPLSLFRRVYFNHRRHYLILNPITAEKP